MTLVEILVVMSIMIILVSAVVVAVFSAQRKGPIEGTKALLEQLAVGLEQYRVTHRMYVPGDEEHSTYPLWHALEYDGQYITVGAQFKAQADPFTDPGTGAIVLRFYYQDAWRQPLRYICDSDAYLQSYTRYRLASGGPDLVFYDPVANPADSDDLVKE